MDCRSCSETSKQAHTIIQDNEKRHAGSSNNFYLQTVLAITILSFGNNHKEYNKSNRILQTCSIRNSTFFQLLALDKPEMATSFKWSPGRLQFAFGFLFVVQCFRTFLPFFKDHLNLNCKNTNSLLTFRETFCVLYGSACHLLLPWSLSTFLFHLSTQVWRIQHYRAFVF